MLMSRAALHRWLAAAATVGVLVVAGGVAIAASATARPSAAHRSSSACPHQPQPLPADAIAGAAQAALANARTVHRGPDGKRMRITEAILADDAPARGGYAGRNCGHLVQSRSIVVYLQFPALLPSASLSEGVVLVSRFADGHYRVWATLH